MGPSTEVSEFTQTDFLWKRIELEISNEFLLNRTIIGTRELKESGP